MRKKEEFSCHNAPTVIINGKLKKFCHSDFQRTEKTVQIVAVNNSFLLDLNKLYLHWAI